MTDFVIVGAGECAARAAFALREKGFDGTITMVGAERHLPYERPPLSKATILEAADPKLVADADAYAKAAIEVIQGVAVDEINREAHRVVLSDGRTLPYDKLLLATGARARELPGVPFSGKRVLSLRNHDDALAIRTHLGPGKHVAIVGGGFIGMELAASARKSGAKVTVLISAPRILMRGVPEPIARVLEQRHIAEGVEIHCDINVSEVAETNSGVVTKLSDGREITSDVLVIGIGAIPNSELAEACGLAVEDGIAVDRTLRTSDPNIFAAGDCVSFPLPLFGLRRMRLESWRSATEHGVHVAANMMGASEMLDIVPWFWSEQFDLTLQVSGLTGDTSNVVRRDLSGDAFMLFHLDDRGRLLSASGIGPGNAVARDIRLAELLIAAGAHPDPEELASPNVKLKTLLAA